MKPICETIQARLAGEGPGALREDADARQHVEDCDGCFAFLESLSAVESGLQAMARVDASDEVVEALLARPELSAQAKEESAGGFARIRAAIAELLRPRPIVWGGAAAGLMLFAVAIGLKFQPPKSPVAPVAVLQELPESVTAQVEPTEEQRKSLRGLGYVGDSPEDKKLAKIKGNLRDPDEVLAETEIDRLEAGAGFVDGRENRPSEAQQRVDDSVADRERNISFKNELDSELPLQEGFYRDEADKQDADGRQGARATETPPPSGPLLAGGDRVARPAIVKESRVEPVYPEAARASRVEARVVLRVFVSAEGAPQIVTVLECSHPDLGFEQAAMDAVRQWRYEPVFVSGKPAEVDFTELVKFEPPILDDSWLNRSPAPAVAAAREFQEARASLEGLSFIPANGYFSNSYVPGDPMLRLLQARLAGWDRSIHRASYRVGQPFDAPRDSALAVYLHADRRGIAGEGRALLQVGLQATERHAGRRPAMNLGIVLDLRNHAGPDWAASLRSLLDAFIRNRQPGDRFSVFVAGPAGGRVVDSTQFRHGFLKVTLDGLLAATERNGKPVKLTSAVKSAIESVAGVDDPEAPLGSSAVVLITSGAIGGETKKLTRLAHRSAVAGIPLSIVGVGPNVDTMEIDRVTLAGQGSRRLLGHPSEAGELVERELSAASRAVARAVRLRIRLAPGVKLIEVLGSERLDGKRAQRVRDAEKSIDLRLSRSLGIRADRGEDEQGIQIVIPAFYAGDSHVVLLDVAVPGPGPIADVTARYKDLAHLRNAVSRDALGLGHEISPAGPLERNVLKNQLSHRLSETLDGAGRALGENDVARAEGMLAEMQTLLEGLRLELAGFDHDREIARDIAMLDEYRTALSAVDSRPEQRDRLSDSLRYAARLKLLPHPMETRS